MGGRAGLGDMAEVGPPQKNFFFYKNKKIRKKKFLEQFLTFFPPKTFFWGDFFFATESQPGSQPSGWARAVRLLRSRRRTVLFRDFFGIIGSRYIKSFHEIVDP